MLQFVSELMVCDTLIQLEQLKMKLHLFMLFFLTPYKVGILNQETDQETVSDDPS